MYYNRQIDLTRVTLVRVIIPWDFYIGHLSGTNITTRIQTSVRLSDLGENMYSFHHNIAVSTVPLMKTSLMTLPDKVMP